jgi:hypothetical protein
MVVMPGNPQPGVMVVMADVPAAAEDEWNRWYNEEHVPERVALDGVLRARRWVREELPVPQGITLNLPPKYLVVYEFADATIPAQDSWLSLSGDGQSDWSRRMTAQMRNVIRGGYRQLMDFQ